MANKLFRKATQSIKHGETEEAKKYLLEYVRQDSSNEEAWLMLASLLTGQERMDCWEWALKINPQNEHTRELLLKQNPQGGYADANWQKKEYVLTGIPMPDERDKSSKKLMVFNPDRYLTLRNSVRISFVFVCLFLYLRFKLHLPIPWFPFILINIAIFLVFFVFLYLCLSLHFRVITLTPTQLIIETPKYRLFKKKKVIRIEDVMANEALETKFADGVIKIRNAEPLKILYLSAKQIVILAGTILYYQKHPEG